MTIETCIALLMFKINPDHEFALEKQEIKNLKLPSELIRVAEKYRDKKKYQIYRACKQTLGDE